MLNTKTSRVKLTLRAFTVMESLLTLFVVSLLTFSLAGSARTAFQSVQETIFFWEFEHMYKESQQRAASHQEMLALELATKAIGNGYQKIEIPASVELVEEQTITFDKNGGNSSLAKIQFIADNKKITYQLYIGSGRYKKTEE
ncbi:TPA: competence type IV pilus minor pilin ComGD [Streptococcus suis]